ncbi:MAG: hypothetical protein QOG62_1025 [Thermoleophilaceae bacterium]|nr:hypothetical protein [Thermoleophilaceae bacterium]
MVVGVAVAGLVPAVALSHPERTTKFPDPAVTKVPKYRTTGPLLVVCKDNSDTLLKREFGGKKLKDRLDTLDRCKYSDIQAAINDAKSGYRIQIMPGVYKEMPSRHVPVGSFGNPPCASDYVETEGFTNTLPPPVGPRSNDPPVRPNRNFQVHCPNAKNLIEVVGDPRPEPNPDNPTLPKCIQLCNLQVEGMGKEPTDVLIKGDRKKLDVFRVDRADGVFLKNFATEQSAFNGVDIVEVSGFRISHVVSRYNQDYGVLTFTATNGLYDHDVAYGNGDSGLYPGSTMKGCDVSPNAYGTCEKTGCQRPSIEIRDSESYGNVLGYSGTAGNSTYLHDNDFHDNSSGLSTDSFAAGHPGMPQECFRWVNNRIRSNNLNNFTDERQAYCARTSFEERKRTIVCPQFQVPVGAGVNIAGGNRDLLKKNFIYDNWRVGVILYWVPPILRGENDVTRQFDNSNYNQFIDNKMGQTPAGKAAPNGVDFQWDSEGAGNCWEGNSSMSGGNRISNVPLPKCPGSSALGVVSPAFSATLVPCAAWDPQNQPDPIGCDWFMTPKRPK